MVEDGRRGEEIEEGRERAGKIVVGWVLVSSGEGWMEVVTLMQPQSTWLWCYPAMVVRERWEGRGSERCWPRVVWSL